MIHRLILILVVTVSGILGADQLAHGQSRCNPTSYPLPDLETVPPPLASFYFARLNDGTHVLRFDNTVRNVGQGRLEIQGNPKPPKKRERNAVRDIYQNFYDVNGVYACQTKVHEDTIYHAGHQHFHFGNFASYSLVRQDANGNYSGTKTSFCIMDTTNYGGPPNPVYQTCGGERQGLTPGWGDTYHAGLADQWVVLGNKPLADGRYRLQSTADPASRLVESREDNNTAWTDFTVSGGQIVR